MHYIERLHEEITKTVNEDITEGPLETEETGICIIYLKVTDKKWDPQQIRITIDYQPAMKTFIRHTSQYQLSKSYDIYYLRVIDFLSLI